jgi:hypothetical protein
VRVAAEDIETAVIDHIRQMATDTNLLERLVSETNRRLQRQTPSLVKRRRALARSLDEVKTTADKVISQWSAFDEQQGKTFLVEKLGQLAQRRSQMEKAIAEVDDELKRVRG